MSELALEDELLSKAPIRFVLLNARAELCPNLCQLETFEVDYTKNPSATFAINEYSA